MNNYYAETAYRPDTIPEQPVPERRSWLRRFSTARLPWGQTQELYPVSTLQQRTPSSLRASEKAERELATGQRQVEAFEEHDYHGIVNHERIRYAPLSKKTTFWLYLWGGGRFVFYCGLGCALFVFIVRLMIDTHNTFAENFESFLPTLFVFTVPAITCWAIGSFVVHKLPNWFMRPSKGPRWELNRRTGMVTLFDYDNMGKYKSEGLIGEFVYAFHEFDAYVGSGPTRQGHMFYQLYMAHRYRNHVIDLDVFVPRDSEPEPHYAGWDFVQNYMDTSRPLPDIPLFEPHREQDPVTAEYDRHNGRDPRYWRDMDDTTWDAKLAEMRLRVHEINTRERFNEMAAFVEYVD
ncbi:MAG TPA: hypothetical protein ENI17_00385 [Pseudomonas xinjiangensis]|uniref:Uncharacterized protein n=2 Tax=root TaxID=1 RepID=A0A7V1BLS6_9GAMM|nr:hypothetical protein [Halopseudomonas xinjiangensis]HEC46079.1 hypothetical protein [Halopseudomonas xinjiangensis]